MSAVEEWHNRPPDCTFPAGDYYAVACARCNQTKKAAHPMDFAGVMF